MNTLSLPRPRDETFHLEGSVMDWIIEQLDLKRAWLDDANCKGMDPNLFFPERGDSFTVRAAKAVCHACKVEHECLEYALDTHERFGILGGESERQRRAILAKRRKKVA
jgi:WhiB family redox-sensing transcriptional regulator